MSCKVLQILLIIAITVSMLSFICSSTNNEVKKWNIFPFPSSLSWLQSCWFHTKQKLVELNAANVTTGPIAVLLSDVELLL